MVTRHGDEQRTTKKVLLSYSANRHLKLSFAKNFQKGIVLYPSTLHYGKVATWVKNAIKK